MKTKLFFLVLVFLGLTMTAQLDFYWENQNAVELEDYASNYIDVVSADVVWQREYNFSVDPAVGTQKFSVTSDGGATWTHGTVDVGDTNSGIAMIHGISATTAWAVAFPMAGSEQGIFKTTDGGVSWNKQPSAAFNIAGSFANVVYFWDENNGFAQGDPVGGYYELYTTNDGGEQWTRVPSENIPAPLAGEYGYTSQVFTAGSTIWWTTNKGRIYRSTDQGLNWEVFESPLSDFGGSSESGEISFNDDTHGYLVATGGFLYSTNNGGESWDLSWPTGTVYTGSISAIPGTNAIVTTGSSETTGFGASFSLDGVNFTDMIDGSYIGMLDVEFLDYTTGYAGSFKSPASTFTDDDGVEQTIAERGGMFKFISNLASTESLIDKGFISYPNPVESIYYLGAKETITNVSVSTILGQQVYKAQPNALTHDIDMSALPHGTYIVNVTINGAQGSVKVIK